MANQTQKADQLIRQTMKINQLMRHKQAISQSIDRNNDIDILNVNVSRFKADNIFVRS
jgi:hypothetical protein